MPSLSLTVPHMLSQSERSKVDLYFSAQPRHHNQTRHFSFHLQEKLSFVKYGGKELLAEASTQSFFHTLAQKAESPPGIPAVYDAFRGDSSGYYFLVMEYIDLPTLASDSIAHDRAVQRAAFAVGWLLAQMPNVPSTVFGSISDLEACFRHRFFRDHKAPLPFVNSEALTKYINKALRRSRGSYQMLPVPLSNDLSICHSDIRKDNFLLDVATDRIWIVDFEHISVLPKLFQQFAFFNTNEPFATEVGKHLQYQPSDSGIAALVDASCILQRSSSSLGLDKFGNPR